MRLVGVVPVVLALGGCAQMGLGSATQSVGAPVTAGRTMTSAPTVANAPAPATASAVVIAPAGSSVAVLDTTSPAEKQASAASGAAGGGAKLGRTIASLGDAAEGGLWLKTALVTAPTKGRVVDPSSGKAAAVQLLPLPGGGGARISLGAMTVLGFGPADLPELDVFRG